MTDNYREFAIALDAAAASIPELVVTLHQKIAMQALRGVVLKTPVDTGRARGNWQTSLDRPVDGTVETLDKNGNLVITKGADVIAKVEPYGVIWLSNNLPYINALEHGHSKQAPNGMVQLTVDEILAQFR